MIFSIELIEAIAKIAVLTGELAEKIIPEIISILFPDHSEEQKAKYHEEIKNRK